MPRRSIIWRLGTETRNLDERHPMAHYSDRHAAFSPASNPFRQLFAWFGNLIARNSIGNARLREADALQALGDKQLAARGLERREIPRHAFRGLYWT